MVSFHPEKFSFEFFPPRSPEAGERLRLTRQRLAALQPDFFSITFGAGGSTRDKTLETAIAIREQTGIEAVPHISCTGYALENIREVISSYQDAGFRHIVALRGDIPSGGAGAGPLRYASELVGLIRRETGDFFYIDVACYPEFHPQAGSAAQDLLNFRRKVEAGANSAITQYFYNPYAYFRFLDSCEELGINIPIVPGIMPLTNRDQLVRFSRICGAEIPLWILKRLDDLAGDPAAIHDFGVDVVTELCSALLDHGAPGLHFYSMNRYQACVELWNNLGLQQRCGPGRLAAGDE